MDRCPPEVLHNIFRQLDFDEVAVLRLAGKKYAEVGIEYLTSRIRFHCTEESITRCKELANHAIICNHITSLVLEGNLLADIGCEHQFAAHFDQPHHLDEKPQPPGPHCTTRERRLHERNVAKYERELQQKYKRYRATWKKQQKLINSPVCAQISRAVALALPRLESVTLSTIGSCSHALSERYIQDFPLTCSMPMDQNSEHAVTQLKLLIIPTGQPLRNLKSLTVRVMSPEFFASTSALLLVEVFRTLRCIKLSFRLSYAERSDVGEDFKVCYEKKLKDRLNPALAAATELRHLEIDFEDYSMMGPSANIKTILGDSAWAKLEHLNLNTVSGDEQYFSDALKRQPSLRHLELGFAVLVSGSWPSLLTSMTKLGLKSFTPVGIFEGPEETYVLDMVDADVWLEDKLELRMAELMEWYVTDPAGYDVNPLDSGMTFADLYDLKEDYGDISDDSEDDDDDDGEDSEMPVESDNESDELPDLVDMDVD